MALPGRWRWGVGAGVVALAGLGISAEAVPVDPGTAPAPSVRSLPSAAVPPARADGPALAAPPDASTTRPAAGNAAAAGLPLSPDERTSRLAKIRAGVEQTVTSLEKEIAGPNPAATTRDLTNAALARLVFAGDAPDAERLLRLAFSTQNMDPNSPDYGWLTWSLDAAAVHDKNAIEFGTQSLGPILLRYRDRLSPAFLKEMMPHIQAAFVALRHHHVPVSYTNIYLMNTVNLVLLGEAVGDQQAAADGYSQLDTWIAYTRQAGIHEFDSPTYYFVDLDCLGLGYLYAARAGARQKFRGILDYFWSDIAANFFPGRGSLSGPHSRDYDFLRGGGGFDLYLYAEGLRSAQNTRKLDLEKIFLLVNESQDGYHPGAGILALASLPERVVRSRWDLDPTKDRYNYLVPGFTLGSASGDYNAQDKMIDLELASTRDLLPISVVPDIFDQPYGTVKVTGKDGHSKPQHLPLHPVTAQERGTLLVLLDVDGSAAPETASLATNVLLPSEAQEIWLDGAVVPVTAAFRKPAGATSVVGVREGQTGVAVRIFTADGADGQAPTFYLQGDAEGLRHGAIRYTVYQYQGAAKKLPDHHLRIGLLILAAPAADPQQFQALLQAARSADIRQGYDGGRWEVHAAINGTALAIGRDLAKRQVLYRQVNGKEIRSDVLSVNGAAIGLPLN